MEVEFTGCSTKICAFCTKCIAHSIPCWLGSNILHQFNSEFLTTSSSLNDNSDDISVHISENWTICGQCLPTIQSVLLSKENVNKVECEVRKTQVELLKMMHSLISETNQLNKILKIVEKIIIQKPPKRGGFEEIASVVVVGEKSSLIKQRENNAQIDSFKFKITEVIRDIRKFQEGTQTKFKTDDCGKSIININTDHPSKCDNHSQIDTSLNLTVKGDIQSDSVSLAQQVGFKTEAESISSIESFEILSGQSRNSPISFGECSKFRKSLIKRINQARTISTSKSMPKSSMRDPRRNYSIKYSGSGHNVRFFVEDIEILVVDDKVENEALQCGSCDFKIDKITSLNKRWHVEDKIFEHVLSNHLNLYTCSICGQRNETVFTWKAHKLVHLEEDKKRKWKCDICGKGLTSQSSVKTHKWTHLNDEEKRDEGNRWMMPNQFRGVLVKGMRFQCDKCGKEFNTAFNLRKHEKYHMEKEEREEEQVVCGECGVKNHKYNLKRHRKRWHSVDFDKNQEAKRKSIGKKRVK